MQIFTKSRWQENRSKWLQHARNVKAMIGQPSPGYSVGEGALRASVANAVERARVCHAIAMGRRPVIHNFTLINNSGTVASGAVFAE